MILVNSNNQNSDLTMIVALFSVYIYKLLIIIEIINIFVIIRYNKKIIQLWNQF